jgi:hypothetical protein
VQRRFLLLILLGAGVSLHAETYDEMMARVDESLRSGNMRAAIETKTAWLALQSGAILDGDLAAAQASPYGGNAAAMLQEFERLRPHQRTRYMAPSPPPEWSHLAESYRFGHAKGFFDALCADTAPAYPHASESDEAFHAGHQRGFKFGRMFSSGRSYKSGRSFRRPEPL